MHELYEAQLRLLRPDIDRIEKTRVEEAMRLYFSNVAVAEKVFHHFERMVTDQDFFRELCDHVHMKGQRHSGGLSSIPSTGL